MKTHLAAARIFAASLVLAGTVAFAQNPPPRQPAAAGAMPPRAGLAVIDINYIYKNHTGFKAQMDALKGQVDSAETSLKTEFERIQQQTETMSAYDSSSPEYANIEARIAQEQASFTAKANLQKKKFLESEAKIYFDTYQQIQATINAYARVNGVNMILRFNREEVQSNNRTSVLAEINKAVVYHNNLDITEIILAQLNGAATAQRGQPAPRTGAPTTAGRPRTGYPNAPRRQ